MLFEELYKITTKDLAPFGAYAVAKVGDVLHPKRPTLIARYKGFGDGQDVEVYVTTYPSHFYSIEALEGDTSVGEFQQGFTLRTGSGSDMGRLSATMAVAISQGMLGLEL